MKLSEMESIYCLACLYGANTPELHRLLDSLIIEQIPAMEYVNQTKIKRLASHAQWRQWSGDAARLEERGIGWTWRGHESYPYRLTCRRFKWNWPILFYKGSLEILSRPAIGIVGTRQPQPSAVKATISMAGELVRRGIIVVSGNAAGIDTAAHDGALNAGGATVYVLPFDLQRALEHIGGRSGFSGDSKLMLSPFLPGDAIHRGNFIRRNELLAGLCDAIVVGEAGLKSGAFHAVKSALYNRMTVFALCNRRNQPWGEGSAGLLKMGARILPAIPEDIDQAVKISKDRQAQDQSFDMAALQGEIERQDSLFQ